MNIRYWTIVAIVFALFLIPVYHERHMILNSFFTDHTVCYGVSYTAKPAFSQCTSSQARDCYTTTSGGTTCLNLDIASFIAFGGVSLIGGCFILLASIVVTYPVAKRLDWL